MYGENWLRNSMAYMNLTGTNNSHIINLRSYYIHKRRPPCNHVQSFQINRTLAVFKRTGRIDCSEELLIKLFNFLFTVFWEGDPAINRKTWLLFSMVWASLQNCLPLASLPLSFEILWAPYFCLGQKKIGICLTILSSKHSFITF